MTEKSFILIKPDHVANANDIFAMMDALGEREITHRVEHTPREVMENHYSPHKEKYFFDYVVDAFVGRPVVICVYSGENIIEKIKDITGVTDPKECGPETIRGKFSDDSLEESIEQKRCCRNVIHRSDCQEEALREIDVWKAFLK